MAIDKSIESLLNQDEFEMGPNGLTVVEDQEIPDDSLVTEMDDGSMVVDFDPMAEEGMGDDSFESNLAEFIDENEFSALASDLVSQFESDKESDVNKSLSMITSCIDMIYDNEESWDASDSTQQELEEFIEQLNSKQFKSIEKFFETMPKLSHKVKVTNPTTEVESEIVLEGLASFFT